MKPLTFWIAALAIPAGIASAQTTTPPTHPGDHPPLTSPSAPAQTDIPALSGTPGVTTPPILNMNAGSGPQVMPGVVSQLASALGASLSFTRQTSSGAVVLSGPNGAILVFWPFDFQTGDIRANGVYPVGNGQYQVVNSGNALTITPAVTALDDLANLLPGVALTVSDKGIVSGNGNGTIYSVQPEAVATTGQAGTAKVALGTDGGVQHVHFTDAAGNGQRFNAGFADITALQTTARSLDSNSQVTVNLDGTASLLFNGQRFTLVPDITLGPIPSDKAGQLIWQEGANRFRISNGTPSGTSQGFSVR